MVDCSVEIDTYANDTNPNNKTCRKCTDTINFCSKCNNSTYCNQCSNNKFLTSNHSYCIDDCNVDDIGSCSDSSIPDNKTCLTAIISDCL